MKELVRMQRQSAIERGEEIEYELSKITVDHSEKYLVSVSYMDDTSLCALDLCDVDLAMNIFTLLINSHTTPLSLTDTVYDLLH